LVKEKTWSNLKNKRNLKPIKELKLQINPSNQNPLTKKKFAKKVPRIISKQGIEKDNQRSRISKNMPF
jgi:hypothetical protein